MLLRVCLGLMLLASAGVAAVAEPLQYEVDIPDGESVAYSVDLDVPYPGRVAVRVDGSSKRVIALRLEPPAGPSHVLRRAGLPPLALATSVEVGADEIGTWHLELRAVAGTGAARLRVAIDLPGPPEPPAREAAKPAAPSAAASATARPRFVSPPAAPPELRPFLVAAEQFALTDAPGGEPPVDACRWQNDLADYLSARATGLIRGSYPARPTRELLDRVARAIDEVAALRTSTDPILAGPPPRDPSLERAWRRVRAERLAPLEAELDDLLTVVQRDYAPELQRESWPSRLVTCLTACERYFGERATGERHPTNRDLAEVQWPRIVDAARALRELSALEPGSTAGVR